MSNSVPDRWSVKSIGELVTLQYGKSPKDIFSEDGEYPVIGTGGVTGSTSAYLHEGGTTVIGRKGTINKPSYVDGRFWAIDTTYFGDNYRDADPKWFYYSLNSFDLAKYNEASGVPSLNRDTLNAIQLLKPPLPEQQKIATILSSADEVIEKTRAQIDKLKDLKTGMMQELLTKGIGSGGVPHTEFKDSPVGRIPVGWNVETLGKLAEFWSGYAFKSSELSEHGMTVVRISNLHKPNFPYWKYDGKIKETWVAEKGDVLFSWAGVANSINVHQYMGERALLNQHIYNFRFESDEIKLWTYQILKSLLPHLKASIEGGAGQLHLTKSFIQSIAIPLPPQEERAKIAGALEAIDFEINAVQGKVKKRTHLKKP